MEVILVVEGKEGWARRLAEGRRQQGLSLPSVELVETASSTEVIAGCSRSSSRSSDSSTRHMSVASLVRRVVEAKEGGRVVISFI